MGDQARRSIREELLSIVGIADAALDGEAPLPEGVKVQLAPGADPDEVGREVARVLAGHGMRSRMVVPGVAPHAAPPPPAPRTVINLAEFDQFGAEPAAADAESGEDDATGEADRLDQPENEPPAPAEEAAPPAAAPVPTLRDVTISQRASGVAVSVAVGDGEVQRVAVASEGGIDQALLEAVCELLGVEPVPALVSVSHAEVAGCMIVSILIDDGATRRAGSAVDRGNRPWAAAKAFWSALSGPA